MVRATAMAARMNAALSARGCEDRIEPLDLRDQIEWISTTFGPAVRNTGRMLDHALALEERVLLEGAQGCLLDIDQGTYPYVTSSITSRANATHGAGIHPGHVDRTIGVVKAYTTRVSAMGPSRRSSRMRSVSTSAGSGMNSAPRPVARVGAVGWTSSCSAMRTASTASMSWR